MAKEKQLLVAEIGELAEDNPHSRYYEADVACSNCGFYNGCIFAKGIPIDQYLCPSCNCQTLKYNN